MKKTLLFLSTIVTLLLACNNKKTAAPAGEEHAGEEEHASNIVVLTEAQMKTANIQTGTIEQKNLKTSIRANGMLSVPNHNKGFVTSVNSGIIKTLLIHPGMFVRKGQAVATIINPDVAACNNNFKRLMHRSVYQS
jgi:predicted deacylase